MCRCALSRWVWFWAQERPLTQVLRHCWCHSVPSKLSVSLSPSVFYSTISIYLYSLYSFPILSLIYPILSLFFLFFFSLSLSFAAFGPLSHHLAIVALGISKCFRDGLPFHNPSRSHAHSTLWAFRQFTNLWNSLEVSALEFLDAFMVPPTIYCMNTFTCHTEVGHFHWVPSGLGGRKPRFSILWAWKTNCRTVQRTFSMKEVLNSSTPSCF